MRIVLDPDNQPLRANLEYASARVEGQPSPPQPIATSPLESVVHYLRSANESLIRFIGERAMVWTLAISSLVFWGLVIARTIGSRFPIRVGASLSLAILIVSLTSITLLNTQADSKLDAVIVSNEVSLYAGDGEQFAEVASIDSAQGHRVEVLGQRGLWTHVRTVDGRMGWLPAKDVERVIVNREQDESLVVANHRTPQLPPRDPDFPLGPGV